MSGLRPLCSNAFYAGVMLLAALTIQACGQRGDADVALQKSADHSDALWSNGDFESGNTANPNIPVGWVVNANLNGGLFGYNASAPPQTIPQLGLGAGGWQHAPALGPNTTLSINDNDLGPGQSFRYPRFGSYADVVNYGGYVQTGNNSASTTLQQNMNVTLNDVDPSDNQVHIRFAYAPVLELPAHQYFSQPYYLVQLLNLSRNNAVIYSAFSVAGAPGVPWNSTVGVRTGYTTQWVDWTLADITPQQGSVNIGDTVQLSIVATGCRPGGHFGRMYVDGVGPQVPGPYVSAIGPTQAAINSNITYTIRYANGASTPAAGTLVTIVTPQNTNIVSVPAGCSTPASVVGPATISCPIGTLSANGSGTMSLTLQVEPGAPNVLNFATYSISAVGYPNLLGAQVSTKIMNGTTVDVTSTYSPVVTSANWGQTLNYNVTVANTSSTTSLAAGSVNVYYPQAANVTTMAWTCTSAAACGNPNGTGTLNEYPALAAGGSVVYSISATLQSGSGLGVNGSTFAANVVSNAVDAFPYNNVRYIGYYIGAQSLLTVNNTGAAGTVSSSPAGVSCGPACTTSSVSYATGANVVLNAVPSAGAAFTGWSGGTCSGTAATCTVALNSNVTVGATFRPAYATPAATAGTQLVALQGNQQYAQSSNAFSQQLWAIVLDANGTPVPSANVTFTVAGANATLSSTVVATNANGIAATTATAGTSVTGTAYNVVASTGALTANFALTNVGPAATITYLAGGGSASDIQIAGVNSYYRIPLTASLKDSHSNPVPNASVTFVAPASGVTIAAPMTISVTSDSQGHASTYVFAGSAAGTFIVSATSPTATGNANFFLNNVANTPYYINYISGTGQGVTASTSTQSNVFSQPLALTVSDQGGDTLSGVNVTFTVNTNATTNANCTLSATSVTTNTYGIASVSATAGMGYGTYTVVASVVGTTTTPASMTFTLSNDGTQVLSEVSGSPQAVTVGTAFSIPFAVKLTDMTGAAVASAALTFTTPAAATASVGLSSNTNTTNTNGVTYVTGTANTHAGNYNIVVNATSGKVTRPLLLNITNKPGSATGMAYYTGNNQNANVNTQFTTPLTVQIQDQYGNGVPGTNVVFAAPSTGASVSFVTGPSITSDANGLAAAIVTANLVPSAPATYNVTATSSFGVYTFALRNTAGAPAVLAQTAGSPQSQNVNTTFAGLTGSVKDAYGNLVGGAAVTFTVTPAANGAGATPVPVSAVSDANGAFTFSANANTVAGTYSFTASSGTATNTAAVWLLTNKAGPATTIGLPTTGSGNNQNATVHSQYTSPLVALVTDAYGNPASGASVTFTVTPAGNGAGGAFTPTNGIVVTDASGHATITFTANNVADDTGTNPNFTVTATTNFGTALYTLTNTPAAPASIVVSPATTATSPLYGAASQNFNTIIAEVVDTYGNPISNASITFVTTTNATTGAAANFAGAASITGTTSGAPAGATVQATSNANTGAFTLAVTSSGLTGTVYLQTTGPASQMVVTGGGNQTTVVGTAFASGLQAALQDAQGQGVPNQQVVFTVPSGDPNASLSAYTFTTSNTGAVNAAATAGHKVGPYQVQAAGQGFNVTFFLSNTPGSADAIAGGTAQNGNVGTRYTDALTATVTDKYGNGVPNAGVTFSVQPGTNQQGATVSPNTVVSDGNGVVSTVANANTVAGAFTVTASTGVTSGVASTVYNLTNVAGSAFTVSVASGNNQSTTAGSSFNANLVVHVVDQYGNPVPNAALSITAPTAGPSATFNPAAPTSDSNGNAIITTTAGDTAGNYNVTIAAAGATTSAVFALTNTAGAAAQLALVSGSPQSAEVRNAFSAPLVVEVEDPFGNPVAGVPVNFSAPAGKPSVTLSQGIGVSDGNGQVAVTATAQTAAGQVGVNAQIVANNSNVQFTLTATPGAVVAFVADANDAGGMTAALNSGFAQPLGLTAVDTYGNPVPGAVIDFTVPSTGPSATLGAAQVTADGNGHVQVQAQANATPGDYTVTAQLDGAVAPVASFGLTNSNTQPLTVAAALSSGPQATAVTTAFTHPIVVQVLDANSNPVSGKLVQFSVPGSGATATLSANGNTTDISGFAEVIATAGSVAGTYDVVVHVLGAASSAVVQLTNTPGAPASVVAGPGTTPQVQLSNSIFAAPLVAVVYDAEGNVVPNANVTWAAAATSPTAVLSNPNLQSGIEATDGQGQSIVSALADPNFGAYTVTATVQGVATPATFALRNASAAPSSLSLVQGAGAAATVNTAFASELGFIVRDGTGAPETGVSVTVVSLSASGSASATFTFTALSDQNGFVQVPAVANTVAGTFQATASISNGAAPVTFSLTNLAGAVFKIIADPASQNQNQFLHHFFAQPLVAQVSDAYDNPIVGEGVTFTSPTAEPNVVLSATNVITDLSGNAQVLAIAGGRAGAVQTVSASYGVSAGIAYFPLTNVSNPNSNFIALLSGGGQAAHGESTFASPLVFVVYDGSHYAAPGVSVVFSADSNFVSLDKTGAITDASGQVATTATAKLQTGSTTVTATESDDGAHVSATLSVTLIPTATHVSTPSPEISLGQALDLNATVVAQNSNATPTGSVHFLADGNSLGTATLDAHGQATLQTTPPRVGSHKVTAQYVPTGPFEASASDASVLVVETGWHAVGNNCAEGSTDTWLLVAAGLAIVAARAVRRKGS